MAETAARWALRAAGSDDEVVVADNGDTPLVLAIDDVRLRVLRADRVYSMPDNWERALSAAHGEDLILLGDRHRVVPGAIERLLAVRDTPDDVVVYSHGSFVQSVAIDQIDQVKALVNTPGTLEHVAQPGHSRKCSSREVLNDWYRTMRYTPIRPMLSTAIVPRRIVDDAVRRFGRFFHGMAPDVASGLQIAANTVTYVETDIVGVVGQHPSRDARWSNGTALATGAPLGSQFVREFGSDPLRNLPVLNASVIYQTLAEFSRLRPDCAPPRLLGLSQFARSAAIEIESSKRPDRFRQHRALLAATQNGKVRPMPAFAQARTLFAAYVHPDVRQAFRSALTRVRNAVESSATMPSTNPAVSVRCAGLEEAMAIASGAQTSQSE